MEVVVRASRSPFLTVSDDSDPALSPDLGFDVENPRPHQDAVVRTGSASGGKHIACRRRESC